MIDDDMLSTAWPRHSNPLMDAYLLGPYEGNLKGVREPYGPDEVVFGPDMRGVRKIRE